jgi:uncharacterized protein
MLPARSPLAQGFGLVWRLALYAALLIAGIRSLSMLVKSGLHRFGVHFAHPDGTHPVESLILSQLVILAAAGVATALLLRTERDGMPALLPVKASGGRRFLRGTLWGVAGMSVLIGLIAGIGGYRISGLAVSGQGLLSYALLWLLAAAINGVAENLAIFGYPLLRCARTLGFVPAILLTSALFTAAHMGNPGENPLGLLSIFLTGVLFAVSIWRTGDLWLSAGLHAGFLLAEDFLFAVPDSGAVYTGHLVISHFNGPTWLTGGAAGPEGSVLIFPLLIAGIALVWRASPRPLSPRGGDSG